MSNVPWRRGQPKLAGRLQVVPISRAHVAGFHVAVDSVAPERRYLAMLAGAVVRAYPAFRLR